MSFVDFDLWRNLIEKAMQAYDEPLAREVAGQLIRPRSYWPLDDLIDKCLGTLEDVTQVDRRLKTLEPEQRQVLALFGHSQQAVWHLGNVVELVVALGHEEPVKLIHDLLLAGLLYPVLDSTLELSRLKNFDQWISLGTYPQPVCAHPLAMMRVRGEPLPLGEPLTSTNEVTRVTETDGLEWPLRLAVLWQELRQSPLRRTQQGELFKRDQERVEQSSLLNAEPVESGTGIPDPGFFVIELSKWLGLAGEIEDEIVAQDLPESWEEGLIPIAFQIWKAMPMLKRWNVASGQRSGEIPGNPYPSAQLLLLLRLGELEEEQWAHPEELADWLVRCHPFWQEEDDEQDWVNRFLCALALQMRWTQRAQDLQGRTVVRLAPLGRRLLGLSDPTVSEHTFPKTLLVQPNMEIVAYRQGLTPSLIRKLTRFATWQSLGAACTLQLEAERTYQALELGESLESIVGTLQRHGTHDTPQAVIDTLKTWSQKRERIRIYASGTLLEMGSAEEATQALERGLPGTRLSDRLIIVAKESDIDYSHFRLVSTRDYAARPEQCATVGEDGLTLTVDLKRSDLMLESELSGFAVMVEDRAKQNSRIWRITPTSLAAARESGWDAQKLQTWFLDRTGEVLPAVCVLMMDGKSSSAPTMSRHVVLRVETEILADGLMQWEQTRPLIRERLGPTALSVNEDELEQLREHLREIGISLE